MCVELFKRTLTCPHITIRLVDMTTQPYRNHRIKIIKYILNYIIYDLFART